MKNITDFSVLRIKDEAYDIMIKHDGSWWHEGAPIKRQALVQLFNTVLRYDGEKDEYWLVTPAEAGRIKVEDVPYVVTDFYKEGGTLYLVTNLGKEVAVSDQNPIDVDEDKVTHMMLPYVDTGDGLKARLGRAVYYKLIDMAQEKKAGHWYITSAGQDFLIGIIDDDT